MRKANELVAVVTAAYSPRSLLKVKICTPSYPSCGFDASRGALPNLVVGAVLRPEDTWPPREPPYSYTGPGVSLFVAWSREEDPKRGVGAEVNTAERPKESAVV